MRSRTDILPSGNRRLSWRELLILLPGTGLGTGYAPIAPGTVGSLLGPPLVWGLGLLLPWAVWYWTVAAVLILAGIPLCTHCARIFGRCDPPQVVYDEITAFFLVFLLVEVNLTTAVLGFLWFRVFDIIKPWPVRQFERLPEGAGIMADDLVAGLCAAVALWGTLRITGL